MFPMSLLIMLRMGWDRLLDECRAEFVHSSDVFSIGLYTNRDVPLARSDPLDT